MLSDHDALLRAIAEFPGEDTPRLVYADWLDDNGQSERAEFVRVQVELARMSPSDPGRRPWVVRNLSFLKDYAPTWRAELPKLPGIEWGDFNRGLIEEVQAYTEAELIPHAAIVFAEPGIHVLRLRRLVNGRALGDLPELSHVRVLRIFANFARADSFRALLASPHLRRVLTLDIASCGVTDAAIADIADGRFPELAELWLGRISDAAGLTLAQSPHLAGLQFLYLFGSQFDPQVRRDLKRRFGANVRL